MTTSFYEGKNGGFIGSADLDQMVHNDISTVENLSKQVDQPRFKRRGKDLTSLRLSKSRYDRA